MKQHLTCSGFLDFGLASLNGIDVSSLESGDTITDLNGKGKTYSVNVCAGCGKRMFMTFWYGVPIFCQSADCLKKQNTRKELASLFRASGITPVMMQRVFEDEGIVVDDRGLYYLIMSGYFGDYVGDF